MASIPILAQDQSIEDPLDSPEQLTDQLESLSYLCRFQYEQFSEYLCSLMDPILRAYTQALTSPGGPFISIWTFFYFQFFLNFCIDWLRGPELCRHLVLFVCSVRLPHAFEGGRVITGT